MDILEHLAFVYIADKWSHLVPVLLPLHTALNMPSMVIPFSLYHHPQLNLITTWNFRKSTTLNAIDYSLKV